jgi:putative nucleotidyltransferase with HDIG domain
MAEREKWLVASQGVLLAAAVTAGVALSETEDWRPVALVGSLLTLSLAGQWLSMRAGSVRISPSFLAIALAMALLGPSPAAAISVITIMAWSLWRRTSWPLVLNNVATYATFPLVGGVIIEAAGQPVASSAADFSAAALVCGVYLLTNLLNFTLIVGYVCLRDGRSLLEAFSRQYVPVFPLELATGIITAGSVLAYQELGVGAVGLMAVMLFTFQYLLRAIVDVEKANEQLEDQVQELAELHEGILRVMLETLSMRDEMTARHSAAVARFARALAEAAGLPEHEQKLAHRAGLLHDIGKFTFPDAIITSRNLSEADWQIIRAHPQRGAEIVRRVRGYSDVADIILCHHERVDGLGYPNGLAGADIPQLARMISVADAFDVMTARDSYQTPVSTAEALAELRRVAGRQLDAGIVELFAGLVEGGGLAFGHDTRRDLEAELTFDRPDGLEPAGRILRRRRARLVAAR